MNRMINWFGVVLMAIGMIACDQSGQQTSTPAPVDTSSNMAVDTTTAPAPTVAIDSNALLTLPILDAFLADSAFVEQIGARLGLDKAQIDSLRAIASEAVSMLSESYSGEYPGSTEAARQMAIERIGAIIGPEKTAQLASYINQLWSGADSAIAGMRPSGVDSTGTTALNAVPADTRVVVNAPAYRMDVFENGRLVSSYSVGIGYPEFPLPTGMRSARQIIFNPTWTPPDEPWVEGSKRVKPGETVAAGSKLNPLGALKIPIGLPSLIHGGKASSKIGTFASHGCVGLTDPMAISFAKDLARLGGTEVSDSLVKGAAKNKKETRTVDLPRAVPVELRYETLVVQDGALHIYRDVYDRNTNTEANLGRVLSAYGITINELTEEERTQTMAALREMSRDAKGRLDSASDSSRVASDTSKKSTPAQSGKVTRTITGKKEMVIPIAALKGKGYPAPVKPGTSTNATAMKDTVKKN